MRKLYLDGGTSAFIGLLTIPTHKLVLDKNLCGVLAGPKYCGEDILLLGESSESMSGDIDYSATILTTILLIIGVSIISIS